MGKRPTSWPISRPPDYLLSHLQSSFSYPALESVLINVSNDSLLSNPVLRLSPHYIGSIWHCWPCSASWKPLFQPLSGSVPFQFLLGFFIPPIPGMSTFRRVLGCAHFCLPPSPLAAFLSRWALLPLNVPSVVSAGHIKFLSQVPLSLWGAAPFLNHLLTLSFDTGTSTQKLLVSCASYPLLFCHRVSCQARNQDS